MVLAVLILISCSLTALALSPSRSIPFLSRYEFYDSVIDAKEALEELSEANAVNGGAYRTHDNLEEIVSYIDFRNVVDEVELEGIRVRLESVSLQYISKVPEQMGILRVTWHRNMYFETFMCQ